MRYKQATLFRTPLKSDLSEVFDGFASKQHYLQFLRGAYPNNYAVNSAIDFPLRAIKTRDLETTLVIPMSNEIIGSQKYYKDFNPLDWNYCALTYQYYDYASTTTDHLVNDVKFYFITGAESLNDDPKRGTCKLYLTEDCWANYYLDFAGSNDTHYQFMHRSTQNLISRTVNGTKYIINKGITPNIKPDDHSYYYLDDNCILSVAMRFTKDQIKEVRPYGSTTPFPSINGSDPHQNTTPIFYYPLCDLGRVTRTTAKFTSMYGDNDAYVGNFSRTEYQLPEAINKIGCIDAWLTVYGVHAEHTGVGASSEEYTLIDSGRAVSVVLNDDSVHLMFLAPIYNWTKTDNFVAGYSDNGQISTDIQTIINTSEYYHTYPFSALMVKFGPTEVPINISNQESVTLNVVRDNKSAPYFTYQIGGAISKRYLINESLKVSRVNDSLDIMLNNNSNQIQAKGLKTNLQILQGLAAVAMGASLSSTGAGAFVGIPMAVGGVFGTASGVANAFDLNAQISDADNRLDTASIPSLSGTDSIFYDALILDRAWLINYNSNMAYYPDMHYKGCYFDQPELLTKNYKEVFDYAQTLECSIPQVKNPLARERLEQAYNRGITRFHIKTVDDELYDYVINMEKDVTNRSV